MVIRRNDLEVLEKALSEGNFIAHIRKVKEGEGVKLKVTLPEKRKGIGA